MTQIIKQKPQRLVPIASPGDLLKRAFDLHARLRIKETLQRDPVYLTLIRQCPCLHCGLDPCGEAAHVRFSSGAHGKANALGKRPSDRWTAPLCGEHHRLAINAQHNKNERQFWVELGIPILDVCQRLYVRRGDLIAMRAVALNAIAERRT